MSKPEPAAARHRILIVLNRIVAVLSIGAAILLYAGEGQFGLRGLAAALSHKPLIVHCLLTALLLFGVNAQLNDGRQRGWITAIILILGACLLPLFALVDLAVATLGLATWNGVSAAAVSLEVPGILCGWSYFAVLGSIANGDQETDNQGRAEAVASGAAALAADVPRPPGSTLYAYLMEAVLYFLVYVGLIVAYLVFVPYFWLIFGAATGRFGGWNFFFSLIASESRDFPFLVILGVPAFGFLGWKGISAYLRQRRDQRSYKKIRRDLDADS